MNIAASIIFILLGLCILLVVEVVRQAFRAAELHKVINEADGEIRRLRALLDRSQRGGGSKS